MVGKRLFLASALIGLGADRLFAGRRSVMIVVNYHRLLASKERRPSSFDDGVFGPDVSTFRKQMEWLKESTELLNEESLSKAFDGGDLAHGKIYSAVTFDDAYIDCYTLAKPVLDDLGIRGIFFVPVEMIESRRLGWWDVAAYLLKKSKRDSITLGGEQLNLRGSPSASLRQILKKFKLEKAELTTGLLAALADACGVAPPTKDEQSAELMSWEQVREMKASGHAIGSHSLSHRVLATLNPDEQAREILGSKRELEAMIGETVVSFAYPVGGLEHINEHSVALAKQAGYEQAFTFNTGIASIPISDRYCIPRESAQTLAALKAKVRLPQVMGMALA